MKPAYTYKAKKLAFQASKILLLSLAFVFIYFQLKGKNTREWGELFHQFHQLFSVKSIVVILFLTGLNWFFEILKWQNLVAHIQKISLREAAQQTFSGMTLSSFTPNGIGEYGAKVLYYPKTYTKQILLLNLLTNSIQMVITTLLGLIGLIWFTSTQKQELLDLNTLLISISILFITVLLGYFLRNLLFFGITIIKTIEEIKKISNSIHIKNGIYGLIRYAVFCHQYYFILLLLGVDLSYQISLFLLFLMYFLSSILPTFRIIDIAIKGSIGMYLFGLFGIEESLFLFAASIMWFCNFLLPTIIGSYFVIQYKYQWN